MKRTAENLVNLYTSMGLTCSTAESCTGGGVGKAITAISGSSAIYPGGVISYANEIKHKALGVKKETLEKFGAVSSECAAEMALGCRNFFETDVAVSVTGIAGPTGAVPGKCVGTVFFGVASANGVRTEKCIFQGDRASVRSQAVAHALGMLMVAAMPEK
jgi:nicotinamide-nucleotide amidase